MSRLLIILLLITSTAFAGNKFPKAPNPDLTPGKLCTTEDPDFWRTFNHGGEDVAICNRNVEYYTKLEVIKRYGLKKSSRKQYKIDHFIPLNIGGSNHISNLFPINKRVMAVYERPEWPVYKAFREGILTQDEAVSFVHSWKSNSWDYQWVTNNEYDLLDWEEQFPNTFKN